MKKIHQFRQRVIFLHHKTMSLLTQNYDKIEEMLLNLGRFLIRLTKFLIKNLVKLCSTILSTIQRLCPKICHVIRKRSDKIPAIILLSFASLILGSIFFPFGQYNFEGNFLVKELSFIVNSNENKTLIHFVQGLQEFDVTGKQSLTLRGKFTSKTNPELDQKKEITLNLNHPKSRLLITNLKKDQGSEMELTKLELTPILSSDYQLVQPVDVQSFQYDGLSNQLSFCLQLPPTEQESTDLKKQNLPPTNFCQDPDLSDYKPLGKMQLKLGRVDLKISLEQVNIPELNLKSSSNNPNLVEFIFTPEPGQDQREFILKSPTHLSLTLPPLTPNLNFSHWIQKKLPVRQVKFTQKETFGDHRENFYNSTMISGEILMTDKSLEVKENQFLLLPGKPGIESLRSIQIKPASPSGLQVRFVGRDQGVEIGLDPNFPVRKIKPLWIYSFGFSSDSVIALLTFSATIIGFLLPYIFIPSPPSGSDHH